MEIISSKKASMVEYGHITTCDVYCIHAKITDMDTSIKEMIRSISDVSWINKLDTVPRITFEATAQKTIAKIVNDILNKVVDKPTIEAGEYMVSYNAQLLLESNHEHTKVPLAELLKEKVTGNPGFDFHTESKQNHIIFGEAKYSESSTPRADALDQISDFIDAGKDNMELNMLQHFISAEALSNFSKKRKGYVAAFSINANNPDIIFKNALESSVISKLINHHELYLIAIEI